MNPLKSIRCAWIIPAVFCAAVLSAQAGGGPQNVLVVVNDQSLASLELGKHYQQQREVPGRNILHISVTPTNNMSMATFSNDVRGPILSYIATAGLSNQINTIIFSCGIPYRICGSDTNNNQNAITAAMFYGFKNYPWNVAPPADTYNDYYVTERYFDHAEWPSSNRYYICTMITGTNLVVAKDLVTRAVQADYTQPTGTVYLFHTLDPRNIQWPQFDNLDFLSRFLEIPRRQEFRDGKLSWPMTNVMGVMLGQHDPHVGGYIQSSTYAKGALAEHLTSFAGRLFDWPAGDYQTRILRWLEAGAAGAYGTIIEPYALINKFPDPRIHYWYGRGFSLGESYFMAIHNPYQGVLVGDALCSPYAVRPFVSVSGVQTNQVVTNHVRITVTGAAASVTRPVDQIDLFLDGTYLATITNVAPRASNVVVAAINSTNCTYVVLPGLSLYGVATGFAASINASNLGVTATAYGDRIEIKQNALGVAGASLTCIPATLKGSAGELTVWATAPYTNFLETARYAYEQVTLTGSPATGDIVRAVVTNLAGAMYSNQVVAASGDTALSLLTNLAGVVNADTNLQDSTGCEVKWIGFNYKINKYEAYFVARTNTWEGERLYLRYDVVKQSGSGLTNDSFSDRFNDNADVLSARATVFLSEGSTNLSAGYSLITTNLADGPHELTVVAYEGTAVKTQGRVTIPFIVDNHAVECAITNPPSGGTALLSESVTAHVQASSVTSVEFYVEGKLFASTHTTPYVFSFAATNYGVGALNIQAKAFTSGGASTLSSNVLLTILPDYDFDALEDNWEIRNWGSITNCTGADDPDSDGVNNVSEYIADTQPTNNASFFRFNQIQWINGLAQLEYVSSTARQYRLHFNDASLADGPWQGSSSWLQGDFGVTTQLDDGAIMPLPTNVFRFYRVQAHRP